jgi:CRISPR-associated protein Cmr2
MTQQPYMLIFSIGPVQSLIAQARKTRDLWLGSYLLAKLMEASMTQVQQHNGQFVFPFVQTVDGYIPDLPNKYIAIFNTSVEAQSAAHQSIIDIEARWQTITQQVQKEVFRNTSLLTTEVTTMWNEQTEFHTFFEVYWIAEPKPTEAELKAEQAKRGNAELTSYQLWLEKAQQSFDARKRLRNFKARDESGEKSTVSGEREALHWRIDTQHSSAREEIRAYWRNLAASHSVKDIYRDGSERLDAIDTVKRFALYSQVLAPRNQNTQEFIKMDFPSTSSMAAASFVKLLLEKLRKAPDEKLTNALSAWLTHTDKKDLAKVQPHAIRYLYNLVKDNDEQKKILTRDGDCFFEATFVPETLKKMYPPTDSDPDSRVISADVIKALRALQKAVDAHPTPYYALLQMDGDHMGTIINSVQNQQSHQAISAALSDFARNYVPQIVQQTHPGRLVYAGGDDVLAFSPLIGLLTMANALQAQYTSTVSPKAPIEKQKEVTASMGIAIAHHFTPLSYVRQAASEAEKLAKNRYGRNTLVVTVLRRSGEQTRVGCKWNYVDLQPMEQPIPLFQEFYKLFIEDKLSVSSIHTLLDEASALIGLTTEAQQSEIKRVLQRQRKNDKALQDQETIKLAWAVVHLAEAMNKAMDSQKIKDDEDKIKAFSLHIDSLRDGLVEVFGWLLVMAFLAREEHDLELLQLHLPQKEEVKQ